MLAAGVSDMSGPWRYSASIVFIAKRAILCGSVHVSENCTRLNPGLNTYSLLPGGNLNIYANIYIRSQKYMACQNNGRKKDC